MYSMQWLSDLASPPFQSLNPTLTETKIETQELHRSFYFVSLEGTQVPSALLYWLVLVISPWLTAVWVENVLFCGPGSWDVQWHEQLWQCLPGSRDDFTHQFVNFIYLLISVIFLTLLVKLLCVVCGSGDFFITGPLEFFPMFGVSHLMSLSGRQV